MASLLDQTNTDEAPSPPVAVVARPGETPEQLRMRHQGYSDTNTGYSPSGYGGSRLPTSPLARSAMTAMRQQQMEDEGVREDREWQKLSLDQKQFKLKSDEADLNRQIQEASMTEKKAAVDQTSALLEERNAISEQYAPGTHEFYKAMVPVYAKYPAAFHANPRIAEMWAHDNANLNRLSAPMPKPVSAPAGYDVEHQTMPVPGGGSVEIKPTAVNAPKAPTPAQIQLHQSAFDRAHDDLQGNIALANEIIEAGGSVPPSVLGAIERGHAAVTSTGTQLSKLDPDSSDTVDSRNAEAATAYATFRAKFDEHRKSKEAEAHTQLIDTHDSLEAELQSHIDPKTGKPIAGQEAAFRAAAIKLNAAKRQLGYTPIDPKTGEEVRAASPPSQAPAASATPAPQASPAPSAPPSATPQPTATPAASPKPSATPNSDEKVVVIKGGKRFRLPKSQLDEARRQGYTLVP